MFNYIRKPKYRFLKPVGKRDDSVLDRPEFLFPEDRETKKPEDGALVNYVRKPMAGRGKISLVLACIALGLFLLAFDLTLRAYGNPTLTVSAIAASSLLFSLASVLYGIFSFSEKDRNYLLSRIGLSIGGLILITWIITMIVGMTQ